MKNSLLFPACLALFLFSFNAFGQAGALDPSFGTNGIVLTDFGGIGEVSELSTLPDGKVRLGGYYTHNGESRFMILQFLPDGKPDLSFGMEGRLYTNLESSAVYKLLPDGKFRTYGFGYQFDTSAFLIQQFLPDGSPDPSFGTGGKTFPGHSWSGKYYTINRFYVLSDLRIILILNQYGGDFILARLLPEGAPDPTFGNMGLVITDLGRTDECSAVYELDDGKLLAAGTSGLLYGWGSIQGTTALVRYLPDGSTDPSFGEGGILRCHEDDINGISLAGTIMQKDQKILVLDGKLGWGYNTKSLNISRYEAEGKIDSSFADYGRLTLLDIYAPKLNLQKDGNMLLLANRVTEYNLGGVSKFHPALFRFLPDGQPDTGFADNGYDSIPIAVSGMLLTDDGKILLFGSFDDKAVLYRLTASGQPDPSFGEGGLLRLGLGSPSHCSLVSYATDTGMLAAGTSGNNIYEKDIFLAHRLSGGSPDPDFGTGGPAGTTIADFGFDNQVRAIKLNLKPGGNLQVAGTSGEDLLLFEFKPDGQPDTAFGKQGFQYVGKQGSPFDAADRVAYDPDGKVLLAGYNFGSPTKLIVQRLESDGSPDLLFGTAGEVTMEIGPYPVAGVTSMTLEPGGKIIIAGTIQGLDGTYHPFAVRLSKDGQIDPKFGNNGVTTILFPYAAYVDMTEGPFLSFQKDGKMLLGGTTSLGYDKFILIRLQADGTLDASFGEKGGWIKTGITGMDLSATCQAIQEDGKILLAGRGDYSHMVACRYTENGSADSTFGDAGKLMLAGYYNFEPVSILPQADKKLIIAGSYYDTISSNYDLALIRLENNGSLDMGFGQQGLVQTDLGEDESIAEAVLQDANRILVLGNKSFNGYNNNYYTVYNNILLARYLTDLNLGAVDLTASMGEALIYPNPVGGQAMLKFELKQEETLSLSILDLQGRVLRDLFTGRHYPAGKFQEMLDLSGIQESGFFILQLKGENGSISIKMIKKDY